MALRWHWKRRGPYHSTVHADAIPGPRYWIDALRVPAAEGRKGRGERERREDYIYQEPCWER